MSTLLASTRVTILATNWDRSKSKKLHTLLGGGALSSEEKAALMTMEMNMDVSLAMATGNVSSTSNYYDCVENRSIYIKFILELR